MSAISKKSKFLYMLAMVALPVSGLSAQQGQSELPAQSQESAESREYQGEVWTTVQGQLPDDLSGFPEGPEIEGYISARKDNRLQVMSADGSTQVVTVGQATEVKSRGGFLGLDRKKLTTESLLNGLPVTVKTVQWGGGLAATQVDLKNNDLKTATMIRSGTAQGFAEQTAATEALRSRVGDIDKYNIRGTTNVYFDTAKHNLSQQAQADLCAIAAQADATENAILLVVGYTDSVGDYDYNQDLSEKRASRVVNYLQQACGWKPYRMLTPTGMAEADPAADNETEAGKAQNRRVAVNILVSKSVDGL